MASQLQKQKFHPLPAPGDIVWCAFPQVVSQPGPKNARRWWPGFLRQRMKFRSFMGQAKINEVLKNSWYENNGGKDTPLNWT